ncbi:cysteine repeat modular protein 2, putative [Plasmodium sp. gorilla clade G3]|nr:cysteine repeat modular protein 2, putative [Plasmodium sp. gorilla clade G3]
MRNSDFFFFFFILLNCLLNIQRYVSNTTSNIIKEKNTSFVKKIYDDPYIKKDVTLQLKNAKYNHINKKISKSKKNVKKKRAISFVSLNLNNILELQDKNPIKLIGNIYAKDKTKFLSTCYENNKLNDINNCNRFTISKQICDAPVDFNLKDNFLVKETGDLSSTCLVDNKPEYWKICIKYYDDNETFLLQTSIIITKDICMNKTKIESSYFIYQNKDSKIGNPILYKGEVIGMEIKNIKVKDDVEGLFNVCSCYLDNAHHIYNKCSETNKHYIQISSIRIIKKIVHNINILTGKKLHINLQNYVTPYPIKSAFIIKKVEHYSCNNINNKSFNEIQEHFYNNEKKLKFYNIFLYETDLQEFKEDIIFENPGMYLLCYTSNDSQSEYSAELSTILVNGYDISKMNYLYLDLYENKLNLRNSVVLHRYNLNEKLEEIFFKKKGTIQCSGEDIIYSNNITETKSYKSDDNDDDDVIIDTIYIYNINLNAYDQILEICSKKYNEYSLIGYATIKPYILHNYKDINHLTHFNIPPDHVRTYVVDKKSNFLTFFPQLLNLFNQNDINEMYLSFSCYSSKNEIIVTYSFDKNMTPTFFKYLKISDPSISILYITNKAVYLYVLKKKSQLLFLYDITPEKVKKKKRIITNKKINDDYLELLLSYYLDFYDFTKCEQCLSPILMEPIYDEKQNLKHIFLITSHPLTKLLIVGLDFKVIYKHDNNAVKNVVTTIRGFNFTSDVLKYSSFLITGISCGILKNDSLDCFLIDQLNNTIIAIEYLQKQKMIIFIDSFQGENKNEFNYESINLNDFVFSQSNSYLHTPRNAIAYSFGESYVIFVNEDESNELNLLFYDKNKADNNLSYITKINNTYINDGAIENIYKFYDHKDLINRNVLLIMKYYEGDVYFMYIPLRSIANKLELAYDYPTVIQDDGNTYTIKIKSEEIKKMNALVNFQIEVHNVNKSKYVTIDKYDGTIEIKLSEFVGDSVNLTAKLHGFFLELNVNITFTVICSNGMKALNGICIPCPLGSYNNINEYIKNNNIYECTLCHNNSTTKYEGSTSISQCSCLPGYELNNDDLCIPCKRGTWKTKLSNSPCIFHCYPNSYSLVEGSRSEEESKCKCKRGFYFVSKDSINFCDNCNIGYFCPGGYKIGGKKCPKNTTNITQHNFSISSCKCNVGFEPFDSSNLNAYNFKNDPIFNDYKDFLDDVESSQICVPCKEGFYKNTVSEEKCKRCSDNVYTDGLQSTSISNCKKCEKGYYFQSEDSCVLCPDNHYCPGAYINDPKYAIYENQKIPCGDKSLTIPPNNLNVSHLNCLCKKGFEFIKTDDNEFDCLEVPKNYYKSQLRNTEKEPCPENSVTLYTQTKSKMKCLCMPGYYWDLKEFKCIKCPKGYYCPGGYLKNCFNNKNLHSCKPQKKKCPLKNSTTQTKESFSQSSCLCDKGYTINKEELRECIPCPINTYKDVISNAECTKCLTPYTTDGQIGSTKEEDCTCSGGFFFLNHCLPCSDKNTYCKGGKMIVNNKNKTIHYGPSKCPPNTTVSFETERPYNKSFCVCQKGFKHVYTTSDFTKICAPCERGFFKTIIGDFSCESKCKPNSTSFVGTVHETHCFCLENYYFKNGICLNCPDGAYCEGGFQKETLLYMKKNEDYLDPSKIKHIMPVPKENYALYKLKTNIYNTDWFIVECPIKEACLYNEKCHESMTNFLCGECKKGYTNNFSKLNLCIKCSGHIMNILHMIFVSIFILLFTVIMAYLNVFTGANRKSVHSIVIKIAVNYFSCMKIFYVMGISELYFPVTFSSHVNYILKNIKRLLKAKKNYGLYCILTNYFDLSHADAYFYGMVYHAFRPVFLAIILTLLMFIVVEIYKYKVRNETKIKLNITDKIKELGKDKLHEEIMNELPYERALVLFRYIPIPGDSRFKRIKNFLEDMIPMYVTLLFFIHTKTTYYMLTLLDCKALYYNDKFVEQYMSYVPSIKCDLSKSYSKFFILGLTGLIVWGIGIPLMSYLVLYKNRKQLHSENILFKYGFLNNGFNFQFWYWESIVFLRKILVLLISTVPIFKNARIFGTTMWLFTIISSIFLTLQVILQPFDSRNYHILNKLETYSMVAWTMTLIIFVFLTISNTNVTINFYVLLFLLFFNFVFIAKILISLCYSYIENLRHMKKMIKLPFLRIFFEKMSKIAEERDYKDPVVSLNTHDNSIQFTRKYKKKYISFSFKNSMLTTEEKNYFLDVISNFIYFGVLNLNFSVFHSYFMEFMLRLSIIDNEMLYRKDGNGILKLIAKDPNNIDEWIKVKEREINKKTFFERHKKILNLFSKSLFVIQNNIKSIVYKGDKHTIISDYEVLINVLKYDEDFITDFKFLYDDNAVKSGLILSDLHLSFTKIKMKDKELIKQLFSLFIAKKNIVQFETDIQLKNKIEQLTSLYDILIKSSEKKKLTFRKNVEDAVKGDPFDYKILENELKSVNDRINNLIENYQKLKDVDYFEGMGNIDGEKMDLNNDSEFFNNKLLELSFKELKDDITENEQNEDISKKEKEKIYDEKNNDDQIK